MILEWFYFYFYLPASAPQMVHISCWQTRQPAEFSTAQQSGPSGASEAEQSQISQYLSEMRDGSFTNTVTVLEFWQQRQAKYDKHRRKLLMARGARASHFLDCGAHHIVEPSHFLSHESAA